MGIVYGCKELAALIEKDGWRFVRQDGSHRHYKHATKTGVVTLPVHNADIKKGTANAILKQAGLK
jgi:predicted RNA binding protein YcfA (HicA-like mRNA interferase family)